MILEKKDVSGFTVEEKKNADGQMVITISGLAFHSSLVVDRIEKSEKNNLSIEIMVYLAPAVKGKSGRFSYILIVPENIKQIIFGSEKDVIWSKNA